MVSAHREPKFIHGAIDLFGVRTAQKTHKDTGRDHDQLTSSIIQSLSAAILLSSGGLKGLQTDAILAAIPFVLVIIIVSSSKPFKNEKTVQSSKNLTEIPNCPICLFRLK